MAILAVALAAGCATPPGERAPVENATTAPTRTQARPVNSPAVLELTGEAKSAMQEGRLDDAAHLLERAIRIESHNGVLWHELARVRYQQGNYDQALQLANRSNAAANVPRGLRKKNDELIEESRKALSY